jgi:hypothetical protein
MSSKKGKGATPITFYSQMATPQTIPSDPIQLKQELLIQLTEATNGNNDTFNYTNALMKEMMKQKLISGKDYRKILKSFYCL